MNNPLSVGLVLGAVVCLAYGCSADDDDTSSPHAGAAGKGGSGAKGGAGGTGAKGGQSGHGGSGNAGSGNAGNGGSGNAGRGGSSGRAGHGGGGLGGDSGGGGAGGYCASEQPSAPLAQCPAFPTPDGDQRTVDTTCSFEDTCRALDCGKTWSDFTQSGCRRPTCTASSDCASDERCVSPLLVDIWDCYPSVYEGCEVDDCSCACSASADCTHPAFCQPASDFAEPFDCQSVSCVDIDTYVSALDSYTSGLDPNHLSDADKAAISCQRKAQRELDDCNGHGGAGAGAGGQSGSGGQSGGGHGGA